MEIPLSSRTPPVNTANDDLAGNSSAFVKDNFSSIEPSTVDDDLDKEGKQSEYAGSVGEDFDEDEEHVPSPEKVRTVRTVINAHAKRAGNTSNKKKSIRKRRVTANLSATKYDIVRKVCLQSGMFIARDDDFNSTFLIWSDSAVPVERIIELKSFQKINHFPSMGEICRKDNLARNMAKMQRAHPEEYNFIPQTWVLPAEYATFQGYCRELKKRKKHKTFIVKPANGAMGNGISLIRNGDRVPSHEQIVIQEYIDRVRH